MSMFNDIVWKENDGNCNFDILGLWSEEKWYGSSSHARAGEWDSTADKMVQRFKEIGHLVFKSISALGRGILKKKR